MQKTFFDEDKDEDYMQNQFMSEELAKTQHGSRRASKLPHHSSKLFSPDNEGNNPSKRSPTSYMDRTFATETYLTNLQKEQSIPPIHSNSTSVSRLYEFSKRHICKVVCEQIFVHDLSAKKWEKLLTDFVVKAVE